MTMDVIFATPIKLQTLNLDTDALSNFCYDIKKSQEGRILSNRGGWQSNDLKIYELCEQNETFKLFVKNIVDELNKFAQELQLDAKISLDNTWINISNNGAYNKIHVHPKSLFSGVYYIKTPENCGTIEFENPISYLMHSYLDYWHLLNHADKAKLNRDSPISPYSWNYTPKENTLLLFPSWIAHQVNYNTTNEDRISIAFNSVVEG